MEWTHKHKQHTNASNLYDIHGTYSKCPFFVHLQKGIDFTLGKSERTTGPNRRTNNQENICFFIHWKNKNSRKKEIMKNLKLNVSVFCVLYVSSVSMAKIHAFIFILLWVAFYSLLNSSFERGVFFCRLLLFTFFCFSFCSGSWI